MVSASSATQTRPRRRTAWRLVGLAALLLAAGPAHAADPEQEQGNGGRRAAEAAPERPEAREATPPVPPQPDPAARRPAGAPGPPRRFTPSEEIDAESVISFPTDV